MRLFEQRVLGLPWSLLALGALGVAVLYVVIDTGRGATGPAWVVLRWFHPLCWALLALAALAKARVAPLPAHWAGPLATAGGLAYAVFLVTWLMTP